MRPLVLPIAAVMLANAPAAFAQEDPSTAGIYPSGMNANAPASFAQENPATAGVYPPDQSGMIEPRKALPPSANENKAGIIPPSKSAVGRPGQTVVQFPGQDPVALPGYPNVSVSGPTVPGQLLPASVNPIPIPGQPGLGSAVVNGRSAIIQMGTNRIIRYAN